MLPARTSIAPRAGVFLMALVSIVHVSLTGNGYGQTKGSPSSATAARPAKPIAPPPAVRYGTDGLPQPVIEMREAIGAAIRSGRVEDLRTAIELNEMKPVFGDGSASDPIVWLKQNSADGEGRELLAAVAGILDAGYVVLPLGRDAENNKVFVWPHFAETGVTALTPEREVELLRLVPQQAAKAMRETGAYDHWRIGIGADGVWHFLRK